MMLGWDVCLLLMWIIWWLISFGVSLLLGVGIISSLILLRVLGVVFLLMFRCVVLV